MVGVHAGLVDTDMARELTLSKITATNVVRQVLSALEAGRDEVLADEWTRQGKASAEVVQALSKHLKPSQMVVLAATVGLANWTNRFNETFAVALP